MISESTGPAQGRFFWTWMETVSITQRPPVDNRHAYRGRRLARSRGLGWRWTGRSWDLRGTSRALSSDAVVSEKHKPAATRARGIWRTRGSGARQQHGTVTELTTSGSTVLRLGGSISTLTETGGSNRIPISSARGSATSAIYPWWAIGMGTAWTRSGFSGPVVRSSIWTGTATDNEISTSTDRFPFASCGSPSHCRPLALRIS